ncbi:MAG: AAA family ATPase [Myxococcales bacterium]|nr:AAA family ATPase [Myxococcales bacterium]
MSEPDELQRPPAELRFADELARLDADDPHPKPKGWVRSPRAVRAFVLGDRTREITPKFVGHASLVDRAMVALATHRGLMLVGEPGTAKSWLSELLSAGISGTSTLVVQGGAATTEDQIKYGWNYALLMSEGPTPTSLVPAPLYTAMEQGRIVRFEEITRCPLEVQDSVLSMLSDRVMAVPELGDDGLVYARPGFNLIATANTRDRGVNEMSAALKRRLNFETVFPIADREVELALVRRSSSEALTEAGVPEPVPDDLLEVLVTTFRELRAGQTEDGHVMNRPTTVLSTAEAVSVATAAGIQGWFLHGRTATARDLMGSMTGAVVKDDLDDLKVLRGYLEQQVSHRSGGAWSELWEARTELPLDP